LRFSLVEVTARVSVSLPFPESFVIQVNYSRTPRYARIYSVTLRLESTGDERWTGSGKYLLQSGQDGQIIYRSAYRLEVPDEVADPIRDRARLAMANAGKTVNS
jgi:hypothetical protein